MLKFFRRIRRKLIDERNLRRYLFYALGEIILVMIGILLALQVNNFNKSQQERKLKTNYFNALKIDIESDIKSLEYFDKINNEYDSLGEYFLGFLEGNLVEIDSQQISKALIYANFKPSYAPVSSTYNDLISSGNLALFEDLKFKNLLDEYYKKNDWSEKFDDRMIKTMWYDYWDERLKYVDAGYIRDYRISEIEGTPIDYKNYNVDFAGLKSSNSFRQQLNTILYQRDLIKMGFSNRVSLAKDLLDYCEKHEIE